jgi:pilus assembly protein Flp/PilA
LPHDRCEGLLIRLARDEAGQDLVEYAMLMAFIALACLIGLRNLGTAVNNTYNSVSTSLTDSLASGS